MAYWVVSFVTVADDIPIHMHHSSDQSIGGRRERRALCPTKEEPPEWVAKHRHARERQIGRGAVVQMIGTWGGSRKRASQTTP